MGDVMPSKMGKPVLKKRRDNTDFTQYAEGGKVGLYIKSAKTAKKKK